MISNYRICKNAYGYYKIQRWVPPKKFLFIKMKGKWVDSCFCFNSMVVFKIKEEAQKQIEKYISEQEKQNQDWKCSDLE